MAFLTTELDPYKEAKRLGKYKTVQSESQVTTEVFIERIIAERMRYANSVSGLTSSSETELS